jgi:hypothetical protein
LASGTLVPASTIAIDLIGIPEFDHVSVRAIWELDLNGDNEFLLRLIRKAAEALRHNDFNSPATRKNVNQFAAGLIDERLAQIATSIG